MSQETAERILVVDGDEAKRHAISRILEGIGFQTFEAQDGRSAIEQSRTEPDLVILDVQLPDMDGFEVCRTLKGDPLTAHIPVLHISDTSVASNDRVLGLDSGADAYLSDATNPGELTATVRALLRVRKAEEAVRDSERRYRTLAEALPQLIWMCGRDGRCLYVSKQWTDYTGQPDEAFLGVNWITAVHPDDQARTLELWHAAVAGAGNYDVEYRLRRADGEFRWFKTRGVPVHDASGKTVRWFGTCTDIHDQKLAEVERIELLEREKSAREQAETANRLKDEFLATLSHELRTPLMAILGWTELLQSLDIDGEEVARGLETIERNARAQAQLIDDLLDVSRIISGKLRLDVQTLNLAEVIHAAIESVRTAAKAKEIDLQDSLDPTASRISGDSGRLQQVVWNLLLNAIKFTPAGGCVTVTLERIDGQVEIRVADTGQGIDPAFLPHVFDRFRQADASSRRSIGGLGLGLAIVRHLVELHGGSVAADSAGSSQGSTFTVRLPLVAVSKTPAPDEPIGDQGLIRPSGDFQLPHLDGIRVLVVDDEADARDLLNRALTRCGASVIQASSADEGVQLFQQSAPDVLISDIGMPGRDGFDFIRQIRELENSANRTVPAVALTAFARAEDRKRALHAGFQLHIAKHVIPSELLTIVASLAGRT
jgi:PAS domain S-box-containing protein